MTEVAYSHDFLARYDEELRFLREEGRPFAAAHPQVAGELGLSTRGAVDPFIERLLEGTAFLTARVHQRLELEQATFAAQMLSRLAPYWDTPTPSMARIVLEPDMASPLVCQAPLLPRGTKLWARMGSHSDRVATFVSGSDIRLWPIEVISAAQSNSVPSWLNQDTQLPGRAVSFLHLRIRMRQLSPDLAAQLSSLPLHLIGSTVAAHELLAALATGHVLTLARPVDGDATHRTNETPRILGLGDEHLLPVALGDLPGARLLREYFAHPCLFLGLDVPLPKAACIAAAGSDLEIAIALSKATSIATRSISASDIATCVVPAINLHAQHCQPVAIDPSCNEYPLTVDRVRPRAHTVHHVANVVVTDAGGVSHACPVVHGIQPDSQYVHAVRRRDDDPGMIMLSIGAPAGVTVQEPPRVALVEAVVCDRDLDPVQLMEGTLGLDRAFPVRSIRFAESPSVMRAVPGKKRAWNALSLLAINPLRLRSSDQCTAATQAWLSCLSNEGDPKDVRRIQSLSSLVVSFGFKRRPGPGPLTWLRWVQLALDVDERCHADGGAVLFGCVVRRALDEYLDINETSALTLRLGGRLSFEEANE